MKELNIATQSGTVLHGVLFPAETQAKTVVIAITGIHGNFYSNPFYYNIGETLSKAGGDFLYAQTRNAFGKMQEVNALTNEPEIIGSFNEDFAKTIEDLTAYLDFAEQQGYENIVLAGHSLGANKVIYYLSETQDPRVSKFLLLSPANVTHLTNFVGEPERAYIRQMVEKGQGQKLLPFELFGWLPATADTTYQWLYSPLLNNVHVETDGDFSQVEKISHSGALLIGTLDRFTYGDPSGFLRNINAHFTNSQANELIFIENTGHTYQQKEQELADKIRDLLTTWGI
ncbi:alpha/beta fold hydrolase [Actinobacillus genomosp. 1]|uniref:alpha/beta fold hydrolase n=1 Tax=Actinobacillus genomosp. 1 TaxID=254839 RepID=UPI002442D4C5|nr:alpha/beta fold hydrolase [Actinobacillus genomosp. 1]WGE90318.1 alpha/beta fold hydrolase [Actinobacillus genomosp. 1]